MPTLQRASEKKQSIQSTDINTRINTSTNENRIHLMTLRTYKAEFDYEFKAGQIFVSSN